MADMIAGASEESARADLLAGSICAETTKSSELSQSVRYPLGSGK